MMTITCAFYSIAILVGLAPIALVLHYWHEASTLDWAWTSQDSRTMYVDGAKTLITASGIAVALIASSAVSSARATSPLIAISAKVAVVALIGCVWFSLLLIISLLRGFERAQSRYLDDLKRAGQPAVAGQGRLNKVELGLILTFGAFSLSCFLVGFLFLGRIAFHF